MKNAVEIANIKLRIESFQEKLRKEKRLQSKPKKIRVQKHVQTRMANARSDIGNDLKRIDKKLAKYNFKLVAKITGTYIQ